MFISSCKDNEVLYFSQSRNMNSLCKVWHVTLWFIVIYYNVRAAKREHGHCGKALVASDLLATKALC